VFSPSDFRELVSGRRRGWAASLLRFGLGLIEPFYSLVVTWRNRRFDRHPESVHRMPVPVISVGNVTLGGTGKTPMVEWISRRLSEQGQRVVIISRGYGRSKTPSEGGDVCGHNDEALELAQRLPGVPHLQNPDRVAAAREAIERVGAQVIVLDDAFQHRRIDRDLDIVLLDALEPFGFDRVFPRGTLREPVAGLARAHVVVLSRADLLTPAEREQVRREVARLAPTAEWGEAIHSPQVLLSHEGRREPIDLLRGKSVAAFCGIGNPAGFRHTLTACGCQVAVFREFPDHHAYTPADVASLADWTEGLDVAAVVCTHKDLVKVARETVGSRPLWAVGVGLEFLAGERGLLDRLRGVLERGAKKR
jgi:tetraacyldisaccharide 4'-kinase